MRQLALRFFADIDPTPRKNWLVSGFLGAGELSCGYGPPGGAKSLIFSDMAAHIAAGRPWFGRRVSGGAVLYIACERGALVMRRFAAWRNHHGVRDIPLAVVSDSIDLRASPADAGAIIAAATELRDMMRTEVALIIVDTASRALAGGDENSPKDVGAFVNNLTRVQTATKAHVLVVHHVPAGDQEKMRGHGALLAACDTTICLERSGDVRTARIKKTNDGDEGEHVSFTLQSVDLHYDEDTGETTTAPVAIPTAERPITLDGPKLTPNQKTMFSILQGAGMTGLTVEEWNGRARDAGLGIKRKADLHDFREALRGKQLVRAYGDRWTVTHN